MNIGNALSLFIFDGVSINPRLDIEAKQILFTVDGVDYIAPSRLRIIPATKGASLEFTSTTADLFSYDDICIKIEHCWRWTIHKPGKTKPKSVDKESVRKLIVLLRDHTGTHPYAHNCLTVLLTQFM